MKHPITIPGAGTVGFYESRKTIRLDETNLCPAIDGIRFNPAIIESQDGYLVIFRNRWINSKLYAAKLDKDFRPTGYWRHLKLYNGGASKAQEDPRWFRIGGKLFVNFVGFCGRNCHVQYASVNEDSLEVERIYWPVLYGQNFKEKNHQYFDYQGEPYAVYTISPHQIIKSALPPLNCDPVVTREHVTPFTGQWSGGHMSGGASPVLHNGEWYSFFHGWTRQENGRRLYNCGCYTFSPEPPFQILRYTKDPFDIADPSTTPTSVPVDVIFPGSATIVGSDWAIAYGVADLWSEVRFYDREWIESLLVRHNA